MADIELVIKIPEEKAKWLLAQMQLDRNFRECKIVSLPKGHEAPTVNAIPMELLDKAINYVEEYICDKEKNTYRAQGMADALTMIEQFIKENKDEDQNCAKGLSILRR